MKLNWVGETKHEIRTRSRSGEEIDILIEVIYRLVQRIQKLEELCARRRVLGSD